MGTFAEKQDDAGTDKQSSVLKGVSINFLVEAFGMPAITVKRKLSKLAPKFETKQGPRYDLKAAAAYLVDPVIDIKSYLKSLRPSDLPVALQSEFWEGQLKQQKFRKEARELWSTEDVMEAFSELFLLVKSTCQLWTEDVERAVGITPGQREVILKLADALQKELNDRIKKSPIGKGGKPQNNDIPEEETFNPEPAPPDDGLI